MRKSIFIVFTLILCFLVGCSKTKDLPISGNGAKIDGEEKLIMNAHFYPGGPSSEEEYINGQCTYMIYSSGKIVDKNDKEFKLSESDTKKILTYYDALCKNKVHTTDGLICDYPGYHITLLDNNETEFVSNANSQIEEVEAIFDIIWTYQED